MKLKWLLAVYILLLSTLSFTVVAAQNTTPDDPNVTVHVVQRGETLFRIAQRYGLTVDTIARYNAIGNPSNIQVGLRLLIPLSPSPEVVPPTTHTVSPGENLQSIATVYGVEVMTLVTLNGITNPNALFVGQVLTIIPEAETSPVVPSVAEAPDTAAPQVAVLPVASGQTHTIQRGETLFGIAQRYGVTLADLQTLNAITDASRIFAGQELLIPGGGGEPQSAVELPPALASIDVTPLTLIEGKTGRVRLITSNSAAVTATFLGRSIPVISEGNGTQHALFLAVPLETAAGIQVLTLMIADAAGITEFPVNLQINSGGYGTQLVTLPADKLLLASQAVEENEYNLLRDLTSRFTTDRYFDGPLGLPATAPMNARFGSRRSYNGSTFTSFHNGADFAGAAGRPVLAAASGRVVLADTLNIRGLSVVLDHGWGVYTNYSHMSERYVNIGEFVQAGQMLGLIGSSGRATGAHLHWELWVNGIPVDPMQWVSQAFP